MLGGDAQRVGDVIRTATARRSRCSTPTPRAGLILADGLVAASEENPAAIVDVATLTGAAVVALGSKVAAVLGNNDVVHRAGAGRGRGGRRADVAAAAVRRLQPRPRVQDRRSEERRRSCRRHDRGRAVPAPVRRRRAFRGPTSTSPVPPSATTMTVSCRSAAPATASAPSWSCSAPSSAPDPTSAVLASTSAEIHTT